MRNHGPVNYTIETLLSDEFSTLEFMATLNPMAYMLIDIEWNTSIE